MNTYAVHDSRGRVLAVYYSARGPEQMRAELDRECALREAAARAVRVTWTGHAGFAEPAEFVRAGDSLPWAEGNTCALCGDGTDSGLCETCVQSIARGSAP
jgi:hypothetical protein